MSEQLSMTPEDRQAYQELAQEHLEKHGDSAESRDEMRSALTPEEQVQAVEVTRGALTSYRKKVNAGGRPTEGQVERVTENLTPEEAESMSDKDIEDRAMYGKKVTQDTRDGREQKLALALVLRLV